MHVTRLRLTGFKSFVDPTEIAIQPGLTGVVGPNGCGKSNLLEALRWVMGENRASAMRGDGMEDVIFAGSATRPARAHAEVALTLDNRDRRAPAGFNDADELDVLRRITRDAGSAYRVSGREARARDVQILFADASTGAQSPALVRQGQIAELVNARPRARRRVLEEAAGIAGLYGRRHEAELKLRATEANLSRVADVIEALETQLAQLSRQARQAARYRETAEALRRAEAMLLWRLWSAAAEERAEAAASRDRAVRAAGTAETLALQSGRACEAAYEALPPLRQEDTVAAAILQRLVIERERLDAAAEEAERRRAALAAQAAQIEADAARETALDRDAGETLGNLAVEAEALQAAGQDHGPAFAEAERRSAAAQVSLAEAEAARDRAAEAAAHLAARHQAVAARRDEASRRAQALDRELASARDALGAARRDESAAARSRAAAEAAAAETTTAASAAEAALAAAETRAAEAEAAERETRAAAAETGGAAKALGAEVAGLRRLLAENPAPQGALLDRIAVEPGFETALGAALADDLAHPEAKPPAVGWRSLAPLAAAPLPDGAVPLGPHVTAPPALARRLAATGLVAREKGDALQAALAPGQRLVSREGDLWRWDGLRLGGGTENATALRLAQKNRLAALAERLAQAERAAAEAGTAADAARSALEAARAVEREARAARRAADGAASDAARAMSRAVAASEALAGRIATLAGAEARRAEEAETARLALAEAEAEAGGLPDLTGARHEIERLRVGVDAARIAWATRRAEAEELRRAAEDRTRRLAEIAREREGWTRRRGSAVARLAELDARRAETAAALADAAAAPAAVEAERAKLACGIAEAETRRGRAAGALAEAEAALRSAEAQARAAERAASEAREARARAAALAEAAEARAHAAVERCLAEAETPPDALLATLSLDPAAVPPAVSLEAETARLRRQREAIGPVNLRAEEDAAEIRSERDTLAAECHDLEAAIAKLRHGIAGLNREGRGRLLAAFETVNRNFTILFRHLFGGGEAELVLVESDDPLEAGLEIMAQPPGKKLSTLSLLSGGEQTLTALSLIFAVFLANPSPICVLDEVDAPLDDANVARFCDLLDEMTRRTETRFLIITHHAVTMARMDRLFGVTMVEPGVSQLVSVDLELAERMAETV